jgi:hypothetical protein
MVMIIPGYELSLASLILLSGLILWETVWKIIALWKSGRNNQLVWFVFIALFNTAGILPIVYLAFFQKKKSERTKSKVSRKRKRR